jgi:hypothetical protein
VIRDLIAAETRGKKAPFARLVGVDPRTIGHWLQATVDVAEESVRRVARATGRNPLELLVQVGYYRSEEVHTPEPAHPAPDEEFELVLTDPRLTAGTKRRIIELIIERRERERAAAVEETRRMIELLRDESA